MTRRVIETITTSKPVQTFEVEYRDSEGILGSAVGQWGNAAVTVAGSYADQAGARIAAKALNAVCGWHTRIVEVGEQ